jgi:hypothetical protein
LLVDGVYNRRYFGEAHSVLSFEGSDMSLFLSPLLLPIKLNRYPSCSIAALTRALNDTS